MKSTVRDVMSTHVIVVRKNAPFKEIAARLREFQVSAFPVVDDDGKVIGVVSEADLLTKEALDGGHAGMPGMVTGILRRHEQEKAAGVTAAELMTQPAVTIAPEATAEHAARLMYARRVKRLPVIDAEGHIVGIISRADVLAAYNRPDEEIRAEIVGEVFLDGFPVDPDRFQVAVQDGIVTLAGTPDNPALGRDMVAGIRHVQGVVAVRDRLSYPPAQWSAGTGA